MEIQIENLVDADEIYGLDWTPKEDLITKYTKN